MIKPTKEEMRELFNGMITAYERPDIPAHIKERQKEVINAIRQLIEENVELEKNLLVKNRENNNEYMIQNICQFRGNAAFASKEEEETFLNNFEKDGWKLVTALGFTVGDIHKEQYVKYIFVRR